MDLKLDPDSGDLVLTEGRLELVTGIDRIAQQARIRFQTFRGEWFADLDVGMPYYERILAVKPLRRSVVIAAVEQAVEGIPGVREVYDMSFDYDTATRAATVDWSAFVDDASGPHTFSERFIVTV